MSQLTILDTGYISNTTLASQTQLGDSDRAGYTGAAVTSLILKNSAASLNGGVNIEQKPIIGSLVDNTSSLVSVNARMIKVSFVLKKEITTSGYNVNNVLELLRLERTSGLKLLYPSATGDVLPTIVEAMGQANLAGIFSDGSPTDDNGTVATTTPYLVGRVKNISWNDTSKGNFWRVGFDFVISG
jgi:hypothetical protein